MNHDDDELWLATWAGKFQTLETDKKTVTQLQALTNCTW